MKHAPLLALLAIGLSLAGCDYNSYTDNGQVTVKNRTPDTIIVHYESETVSSIHDCNCDGAADQVEISYPHHHAHVPSGKEATLYVDSYGFWDGDITVEYAGQLRTYDIDFDLLGFDTIWVRYDDFVPTGSG